MKTVKDIVLEWLALNKCDGLAKPYDDCQCSARDLMSCNQETDTAGCLAARLTEALDAEIMFPITQRRTVKWIVERWLKINRHAGLEDVETECGCIYGDDNWLVCNGYANIGGCVVKPQKPV